MTPTAGTAGLYDVSPGLYWDGAQLHSFLGASGAVLPAHVVPDADRVVDERVYQDGITRACIISRQVSILLPDASRPQPFVLDVDGGITVWHRFQERLNEPFDVKWGRLDTAAYDSSGKGKGRLRGWAIADGRNGTDNLSGRFVVARDPSEADYDTVSKTGGANTVALTAAQNGPHDHSLSTVRFGQSNRGRNTNQVRTDEENDGALTGRTAVSGSGQPHENRPPFYVLAARQWIGFS
jgi:hypothetical protein